MAINSRPYQLWYDGSADVPLPLQGDNPGYGAGGEFLPASVTNRRVVTNPNTGVASAVGDLFVSQHQTKTIVWSSEGYTYNGIAIPALTATQKKATGLHTANAGTGALDASYFRSLVLSVNFISFAGGTSIQFEYDYLDDAATPLVAAIWKPAALTAAATSLVNIGSNIPFVQAAAADNTAPTGFGAIALPTGLTAYSIPLMLPPNGQFQWTVVGTMTAIAWTAFIYGVA